MDERQPGPAKPVGATRERLTSPAAMAAKLEPAPPPPEPELVRTQLAVIDDILDLLDD